MAGIFLDLLCSYEYILRGWDNTACRRHDMEATGAKAEEVCRLQFVCTAGHVSILDFSEYTDY